MGIKNFIKKNYKIVIGFIIGGIVFGGIGVYAVTTSEVKYDNSTSKLTSTNMQGAIDELNTKADTIASSKPCKVIKGTGRNTNDEIACGTEEFYVLYTAGDSINVLTKYPIEGGAATMNPTDINTPNYIYIENPSYAQNSNCGNSTFNCIGSGYSSKYKEVLNKIGLSNDIIVKKPSVEELNKAGCNFIVSSTEYIDSRGSCKALPWLSRVVTTNTVYGPNTEAVASNDSLGYLPQVYFATEYEKLMITIPINNILM